MRLESSIQVKYADIRLSRMQEKMVSQGKIRRYLYNVISIFHGCMVWIENLS